MNASEVLRKALELLGPNGERWSGWHDGRDTHCAYTAIYAAKYGEPAAGPSGCERLIPQMLGFKSAHELYQWNDVSNRTFPEVKAAFEKAISLAEQEEATHV